MSNVWFTSDTHFGHKNIVRGCSKWENKDECRDFPSVEEHDAYIIDQINKRVKPQDTLYHLGDIAWKDRFKTLREQIRCEHIVLILGNHDRDIEEREDLRSLFCRVEKLCFVKIAGRMMTLCHYAMKTWLWQHRLSVHLYGHSHGSLPDDPDSLSLDVGVDTNLYGHERYTPYSVEEVFDIMDRHKRFVPIDHHVATDSTPRCHPGV